MATWEEQLNAINTLRQRRSNNDDRLYNTQIDLQKIGKVISEIENRETRVSHSFSSRDAEQEKERLEREYKIARASLDSSRVDLHEAIAGIYVDPHPKSVVKNLTDKIPFLLMPVRIETRFVTSGTSPELWLRIYPDEISVHTHEKLLTEQEVTKGTNYWLVLFEAEKSGGNEKEDRKKKGWADLVALFGSQRSAWVAAQTKPTNWDQLPQLNTKDQLVFPAHDNTKPSAWSRAPRAYELPDKFVVMLYQGDSIVKEVIGPVLPDELFLGPDPMEADEAFVTKDNMLEFGETFDWTSNFEKAVTYGMGFQIQLTAEQASRGFDKILVLGLSLSINAEKGQENVEALIDNHHYSSKGFSIVKQGTPTNNTDQQGSGYTTNDPFSQISYFVETGDPLFDENTDCDGKNLANALGIKYNTLQYIQNSDAADLKEATAMNTALYPSTLGYYFDTMLSPVLSDKKQQQLRDFFLSYVTGRGPLPAIRVGDQPYGILLTSDFSKWQWSAAEINADREFFTGLQNIINYYSGLWNTMLSQVMYTGKPGTDPSEVLMNILGLQAGSVFFNQRVAYTTDDLKNRATLMGTDKYAAEIEKNFTSKTNVMAFLSGFGYNILDENGKPNVPQLLRLVYQHWATTLNADDVVDNRPLSETEGIQFYNAAGTKNYIHWLLETGSIETLRQKNFGEGIETPKSLLFLQLLRSLLLELHAVSNNWFQRNGVVVNATKAVTNFYNIRKPDITKWELMKGKVGIALPAHPLKDKAIADYLLEEGNAEPEANFLNRMKESLGLLANMKTARLERCFTEHIDVCTYRLDAWQSAFFQKRLQQQRNSSIPGTNRQGRTMGTYLGAFGWVEDVRPSPKRRVANSQQIPGVPLTNSNTLYEYVDNGGFVHAPSLNQAMAAAVLRGGYLNHATSTDPDSMAVNLSSQRVRNAISIVEGIQNGLSVEVLLGYQFERGLHDKGSQSDSMKPLNVFIYDFRKQFPLEKHVVLQQGATSTVETIPATDVVNGLTLANRKDDFPWGTTGDVAGAGDDLRNAVIEEKKKLEDTLDAIKDLLLSESVYQMVQGNFDRGAAVLNSMKDSTAPPEIDIINTPRSSKFTFTNKVTIQFEKPVAMDSDGPRTIIEPGMNKWLGSVLGNMGDLACKVSLEDGSEAADVTMDQLGINPIDLIYIAGKELNTGLGDDGGENSTAVSELEKRIGRSYRMAMAINEETPIIISFLQLQNSAGKKPLGEVLPLLKTLKSLITNSRNLNAEDFVPASTSVTSTTNPKGYNAVELRERIDRVLLLFKQYYDQLNSAALFLPEKLDEIEGNTTLGEVFIAMGKAHKDFTSILFTLDNLTAVQLIDTLILISGFGIADSFPSFISPISDDKKPVLLTQVQNVARRMKTIIDGVAKMEEEADIAVEVEKKINVLVKAGKLMFEDSFNILPVFAYRNAADIQSSYADREQLVRYAKEKLKMNFVADEWLQNIAHVRPRLATWDGIRTLSELFTGEELPIRPVQLPYRANDSWIAVEFPSELKPGVLFNIDRDTLSITIHGDAAFVTGNEQSGLLVDEIVEMIPNRNEITGLTFNYNQPNALPPQAILLAVTPKEKGHWEWEDLVGILNDTLLRAKLRAIEPDILNKSTHSEIGVMLPAIMASFSTDDLDLALDYRTNVTFYNENSPVNIVNVINQ